MKKVISLLMVLAMFLSILPATVSANAEEGVVFYNTTDNTVVTSLDNIASVYAKVTFPGEEAETANILVAHYNKNGILTKMEETATISVNKGELNTYETPSISVADTAVIKVFSWDGSDSITPLLKKNGVNVKVKEFDRPTATVTKLNTAELPVPMTFAMNFKADIVNEGQLLAYGDWYADYVLTLNKDITYQDTENTDAYLAGQYDKWSPEWIKLSNNAYTVEAGATTKIMEITGKKQLTYREVYENVNEFNCGVYFSDAFLAANSDLTATLELRIFNPADATESYVLGESHTFTAVDFPNENILKSGDVTAVVPSDVVLEDGTIELALSTTVLETSESDIVLSENEAMTSLDVHVEGVSEDNTTPILVTIPEIAEKGLNKGNLTLYHVENGKTIAMTEVESVSALKAHNQFAYDPLTGTVVLALARFSEIALVENTENAWNGDYDYSWYNTKATTLKIANADQLAAFGRIVGGMAEGIERDSFSGKTVILNTNINIGDTSDENGIVFYPIGYYNIKEGNLVTESSVRSFEGTFDGNGHTISNFYQNTWEMEGDYREGYGATANYYKDAMGLFGYVLNGTVKNLTVDNFSSDGEFTPTGVIAAYAEGNSNFENIAITNCNPRVYNTGNGGIIGIAGRSNADVEAISLKNITVDNTNKITALWGSWDVACGGLVGMYRGNVDANGNATGDTISFENCHVAAQIDVYNDVCANYQYYAYRYAGMIIGSVRHNTVNEDGKTVPDMKGISASGCTVNYGTWNDYYYCEFEKNSMASYSEDYQFSRVDKSEIIFDENGNITGCTHTHTDKEDKRAVYLPFHQLFTGYSWGVNSIGLKEYSGIVTELDITEGEDNESVVKFRKAETAKISYNSGSTITVGELFTAVENAGVEIDNDNVQITVSPKDSESTAGATYTANTEDWTKGVVTFTGFGNATVTITDYYFCTPTVIELTVDTDAMILNYGFNDENGLAGLRSRDILPTLVTEEGVGAALFEKTPELAQNIGISFGDNDAIIQTLTEALNGGGELAFEVRAKQINGGNFVFANKLIEYKNDNYIAINQKNVTKINDGEWYQVACVLDCSGENPTLKKLQINGISYNVDGYTIPNMVVTSHKTLWTYLYHGYSDEGDKVYLDYFRVYTVKKPETEFTLNKMLLNYEFDDTTTDIAFKGLGNGSRILPTLATVDNTGVAVFDKSIGQSSFDVRYDSGNRAVVRSALEAGDVAFEYRIKFTEGTNLHFAQELADLRNGDIKIGGKKIANLPANDWVTLAFVVNYSTGTGVLRKVKINDDYYSASGCELTTLDTLCGDKALWTYLYPSHCVPENSPDVPHVLYMDYFRVYSVKENKEEDIKTTYNVKDWIYHYEFNQFDTMPGKGFNGYELPYIGIVEDRSVAIFDGNKGHTGFHLSDTPEAETLKTALEVGEVAFEFRFKQINSADGKSVYRSYMSPLFLCADSDTFYFSEYGNSYGQLAEGWHTVTALLDYSSGTVSVKKVILDDQEKTVTDTNRINTTENLLGLEETTPTMRFWQHPGEGAKMYLDYIRIYSVTDSDATEEQ